MVPSRPEFPIDDRPDITALRHLLELVIKLLAWILSREEFFAFPQDRRELERQFETSVIEPVRRAQQQLGDLNERQYAQLREVGLTGEPLRMKWTLIFSDLIRGRLKRIIDRINSFLSSLSSVLPGVDIIKEFKDQTEASMGDLQDEEGPKSLKDLAGDF
jgi:hypothetical protein